MDQMTREEIDKAIGELDEAEREYLKLLISRIVRCFKSAHGEQTHTEN